MCSVKCCDPITMFFTFYTSPFGAQRQFGNSLSIGDTLVRVQPLALHSAGFNGRWVTRHCG